MSDPRNRIDVMFEEKKKRGESAMIFFVTAGFPDMAATETVILALAEAGADLIEVGIPFSDPLADGPTIQYASQRALEAGTKVQDVIDMTARIRAESEIPMIFFSAYNPIYRRGCEPFCKATAEAGVDGMLIPDLPPEEAEPIKTQCIEKNLKLVYLVAPTSTPQRRQAICDQSSGFIYYISLCGVTGARQDLPSDIQSNLESLRALTSLPVAVGFGVSTPQHVRSLAPFADGIVVGSALIDLIREHEGSVGLADEVKAFAKNLIDATASSTSPAP